MKRKTAPIFVDKSDCSGVTRTAVSIDDVEPKGIDIKLPAGEQNPFSAKCPPFRQIGLDIDT
jgi:hypothetical protein